MQADCFLSGVLVEWSLPLAADSELLAAFSSVLFCFVFGLLPCVISDLFSLQRDQACLQAPESAVSPLLTNSRLAKLIPVSQKVPPLHSPQRWGRHHFVTVSSLTRGRPETPAVVSPPNKQLNLELSWPSN